MVLVLWVAKDFDPAKRKVALLDETGIVVVTRGSAEHLDLAEERTGRVRIEYTATKTEDLEDIAKRYGMGSHDLARINRTFGPEFFEKIAWQVSQGARSMDIMLDSVTVSDFKPRISPH
jgi:hypothetical protein